MGLEWLVGLEAVWRGRFGGVGCIDGERSIEFSELVWRRGDKEVEGRWGCMVFAWAMWLVRAGVKAIERGTAWVMR